MHSQNPLQLFKAIYRYAKIPFGRRSGQTAPQAFVFGAPHEKQRLRRLFPMTKFIFRKEGTTKWEFYLSIAPWMLANKNSSVYSSGPLARYIELFCARYGIPVTDVATLNSAEKVKSESRSPTNGKRKIETIPKWFRPMPGVELRDKVGGRLPLFLYLPWIAEHGDVLIGKIGDDAYDLAPFDMIKSIDDREVRRDVMRFARDYPDLYRKMVVRRLVPLRSRIDGFIVTFDWSPIMRIIVTVCRDLGIPTILIPHESVFVAREMYYVDINAKASVPLSDVILGWGNLQREIFTERGYPADRFISVGAPKFDSYHDYNAQLTRSQYCRLFGLDPNKKIILFASQPLDSQLDAKVARLAQSTAIDDLLDYASTNDVQLIVRLPPSKDDILGAPLRQKITLSPVAAYDDATCYMVNPEEAIFHADLVASVNSTMLFEGILAGKPAISMRYIDFKPFWEEFGILGVSTKEQAFSLLDTMLKGEWRVDPAKLSRAAGMFGIGEFDGKATVRIRDYLRKLVQKNDSDSINIELRQGPEDRLIAGIPVDVVALHTSDKASDTSQKYLKPLLKARTLVNSKTCTKSELSSVDVFLQWGIAKTAGKRRQHDIANALGRSTVIIEDGFIRSVGIGLSGEPALAVILDDTTAYYDAIHVSRLERLLQSGPDITEQESTRAKTAIQTIVRNRVSKYNHAPDIKLSIGRPNAKKILLVDQRYGDQSVASGLAGEDTFERMLHEAIESGPDYDIIVKQHPDAITGGKTSYFNNTVLGKYQSIMPNLYTIAFDINPFALFDIVDVVHVATSGMGFEAAMAGKQVVCHGMPYFAGWGITSDRVKLPRRSRRRSIEDVFHFAYIESSRYYNPDSQKASEIEDVIEYIVRQRKPSANL